MNRRTFLAAGGVSALFGISGCIGILDGSGDGDQADENNDDEAWSPDVTGEEPELGPGDETTLQIEAAHVSGVRVGPRGETGLALEDAMVELDLGNESKSPRPDEQLDSMPPMWLWNSQTSVEVEIPVQIADDAETGEYPYEVTVREQTHGSGQSDTFEFVITVVDN